MLRSAHAFGALFLLASCTFAFNRALGPGELRGTAVFAATGGALTPAAGARVVLENSSITVQADARGRFVIPNLPPATYNLTITASQAGNGVADSGLRLVGITLASDGAGVLGDGRDLGQIVLGAFGSITGQVTLNGAAVATGPTVVCPGITQAAVTGGTYTMPNLPPGPYQLTLFSPGFSGGAASVEGPVAVQVVPRVPTTAPVFELSGAMQVTSGSISGQAQLMGVGSNAGIEISLSSSALSFQTSDDSGDYTGTEINAGIYTITGSIGGFIPASVPFIVVGGTTTTVPLITLAPITGSTDAGPADAGLIDAGSADAGEGDAGGFGDGGVTDGGVEDAGSPDAGPVRDGGPPMLDAGPGPGPFPDSWSFLNDRPAGRTEAPLLFDSKRNRLLTFGGHVSLASTETIQDGLLWSMDLTPMMAQRVWKRLRPVSDGSTLSFDWQYSAVLDATHDRVVVYTGTAGPTPTGTGVRVLQFNASNTLTTEAGTWSQAMETGAPPFHSGTSLVYDEANQRAIMFGGLVAGSPSQAVNEIWTLDLSPTTGGSFAWTELTGIAGTPPPNLYYAATALRETGQLLVIGGLATSVSTPDGGTLDGGAPVVLSTQNFTCNELTFGSVDAGPTNWFGNTECINQNAPQELVRSSIGYEATSGWAVVMGGDDNDGHFLANPYALSISYKTWNNMSDARPSQVTFNPRTGVGVAVVPVSTGDPGAGSDIYVFGGCDATTAYNDLMDLSVSGSMGAVYYGILTPTQVNRDDYVQASAVYDSAENQVVLFGGYPGAQVAAPQAELLATTPSPFLPNATDWTTIADGSTTLPAARFGSVMVYDSSPRNQVVVFGGYGGESDTWAFSFGGSGTWVELNTGAANSPGGLDWATGAYDPLNEQFVVFGGVADNGGGPVTAPVNNLWGMPLQNAGAGTGSWAPITPLGTPPPGLAGAASAYDPDDQRMFVFGGATGAGTNEAVTGNLWALSLPMGGTPAWFAVATTAAAGSVVPIAREQASLAYDHAGHKLWMFGGVVPIPGDQVEVGTGTFLADLNVLDLTTMQWSQLCPSGVFPPTPRAQANMLIVPEGLLLYGGVFPAATPTPDNGQYVLGLAAMGQCE